jgi:REP element-mobilizing transposase RayT
MSHTITKLWLHLVFSTKDRQSLIKSDFELKLYSHIKEKLNTQFKCYVQAINGTSNHIHILFLLNPDHIIQNIVQNIKGESSHWVNQNKLMENKFAWQTGYCVFSISQSSVEAVEKYIANQKQHHHKMTFEEEFNAFIKKYGIDTGNR